VAALLDEFRYAMPGTIRRLWVRPTQHFQGHREHCAPGVQEAAVALVVRHVKPTAGVLDLASGSGAMLARLQDVGFSDLHGVRRDLETFGIPETPSPEGTDVRTLDLDRDFAPHYDRRFGLIVSVEVVEHLESPRHFLRQAWELLDDGGHLLLTTPNVANWIGRLRFLLSGDLRWFDAHSYHKIHHISPSTDAQMRAMLGDAGFRIVEATTAGSFLGPLQVVATALVSLPFLALAGRRAWGDCNVYLASKAPR
jgi:2-polyprenyl-3-methyl-5-hydroxy-6-metoxy-1,4-benzoquinol methylase